MKKLLITMLLCACAPQMLQATDIVKFKERIDQFGEAAFKNKDKGIRTESLMVIYDGRVYFEKYAHGFHQDMPHRVWSITKSFVNTIYGIAQQMGILNIDKLVGDYLPEFKITEHLKNIKIRHLLNMNSGIAWNESYLNPFSSNVIKMLYATEKKDMGAYALKVAVENKLDSRPGEVFKYSSGTSNLLMYLFKKIIGNLNLYNYWPWSHMFNSLGMQNVTWEQDHSGTFVGSSYLFMSPRNLMKFARLYMNNGMYGGRRVLPEGWVKQSRTASTASAKESDSYGYGLHFWTNQNGKNMLKHKFLPKDTFFSLGHNGQILMMIPSEKLILIRLAHDTEKLNHDQFFRKFWNAYKGENK